MKKAGQFQISFGVIFSILIIVATLAVAGYIIVKFLNTGRNAECKLFVTDLQNKINEAWSSDGASSYVFAETVPAGTQKICFGYLNQTALSIADGIIKQNITNYATMQSNMYFYPRNSCGGSNFYYTLKHINTNNFFCTNIISGKSNIVITKGTFDALVKLSGQ